MAVSSSSFCAAAVPLSALFGKAKAANVQVSPGGKWLGWLARNEDEGVLDLWVAALPLTTQRVSNTIPGAVQLTRATSRDICFSYHFSADDRHIVYLRETRHGSELYHPYVIGLDLDDRERDNKRDGDRAGPEEHLRDLGLARGTAERQAEGRDLLFAYPHLTCAVGFVGGLQLWLPIDRPNTVILSTGTGSLTWDLSEVDLDLGGVAGTCALRTVHRNPANTKLGCLRLVLALAAHVLLQAVFFLIQFLSIGFLRLRGRAAWEALAPPPAAPLQYFVDGVTGGLVGRADCSMSLGGMSMLFSRRVPAGSFVPLCSPIPLARLNMQLVGSGGATGTLRMDMLPQEGGGGEGDGDGDGAVAVHTCDVGDTTAYVSYPSGRVLAQHPRLDIHSFVTHPRSGVVEAVVVTSARREMLPVCAAGERVRNALLRLTGRLGGTSTSTSDDDMLAVVSRSLRDDIWVVVASTDTQPATFYVVYNPYAESSLPILLLCARPELHAAQLSLLSLPGLTRTVGVDIRARDGVTIPAYLTRPHPNSGSSSASSNNPPTPLALLLHGGPSARDWPSFDPVVQLLSSRGIAVLRLNYRGSAGYGMHYLRLGDGVQGMHNDVEDAREWAVREGVAIREKVVVIGASWGGYLSLGAATGLARPLPQGGGGGNVAPPPAATDSAALDKQPVYTAVVAIVPLVSVGAANSSPAFRGDPLVARYWRQIYGTTLSENLEYAKKLSPLHIMANFKSRAGRLLLFHGDDDPRVPRQQAEAVAAAAEVLGISGKHIGYANEGHSVKREPNVLHMWHEIERFVCAAVGLPPPPPALAPLGCTASTRWESL